MSLAWILLIVLLVLFLAAGPQTGWHRWGYYPSGLIGIVLVVVLILVLMGRL
jgi:hypothetical protein